MIDLRTIAMRNRESVRYRLRSHPVTRAAQGVVAATALLLALEITGAQGVTTAGIRGSVIAAARQNVDARVRVSHDATGFSVDIHVRGGRFLVQGLEPGGPYTVTFRALGFEPRRAEGIFLTLGELREIDFVLEPLPTRLDTVAVVTHSGPTDSRANTAGGTGMTISESSVDRLPTLNRDLYDFVRLVPQISTKISLPNPGLSAGGVGFRFNNFLINGVSERTLSGGVSGAFAGNKSIPLAAVQEYQVLLAPYDVRYGDFAGALVNAVTKSGTNAFRGSLFAYGRNDQLARGDASAVISPYERVQYGFSLGGPIIRNRLHFFVAPELQHFTYPADGPYVGQPPDAERLVPVSGADLDRFDAIMRSYGLTAGSAGPVENGNPLRNLFTRFDLALPEWNSRVVVWNNYSGGDDIGFSRASRDTFSLSTYQVTRASEARISAMQLHTALGPAGGGHNELLVSYRSEGLDPGGAVQQPIVRVSVPSVSGGRVTLNTGTHESAQGNWFRSRSFAVKDNLTLALGMSHVAILGAEAERFRIRRGSAAGSYGTWSFASLDDLALGIADRYEVRIDFENVDAALNGTQYAAYAGDQWRVTDQLSITGGVRADLLAIDGHAPYQPIVDSLFGRRTDQMPRRRIEPSPRLGFVWNVSGSGRQQLRGGLGIFTGRYPLAWAHTALSSYGVGGVLRCNLLGTAARYPPAFAPDYSAPPTACRGGSTITPSFPGDVDLLDRNLRMVRTARSSLAYEQRLPWGLVLTNEALITRALSDVAVLNLNLPAPETADPYGRVMYGTIGPTGSATLRPRSAFSEVIDFRNTSSNHSYQLATRLETVRSARTNGSVSYTYSRARDVQTLLRVNTRGTVAWASARANAGRDDDLTTGISSNDVPHRVIVAGSYVAPWIRARSELSFYYVGESGRPFTYIAYGTLGRGDLNADGSNANDPVYVPRNALDETEIRFSGFSDSVAADNSPAVQAIRERAQRNAFENFVERTSCLKRQRGQIMERNSCREPWSNMTIASVRQTIPVGGRGVEVQLDVFNVLNLLNGDWGRWRDAAPALLEHVGQTAEPAQTARPIFRFDTTAPRLTTRTNESAFQLQLAMRYRF
jgi:hypothetical protein